MTPLEELEAAHKRLSELRDERDSLHRTIDAQLHLLRKAITIEPLRLNDRRIRPVDGALELAQAINAEVN